MTIREAQQYGRKTLEDSPSPALDTDVLLQELLGADRTFLLLHSTDNLSDENLSAFNHMLDLRKTGLPVAYITGHKEFYGIDFSVTPDVLIPKPDTEILVEQALNVLADKATGQSVVTLCDMCTGSGCVGLSILYTAIQEQLFEPQFTPKVFLADISTRALAVAKQNISKLNLEQHAHTVHTNLFDNAPGRFDIITANPPYIPAAETMELLKDGRNEPVLALNGDIDTFTGDASDTNDGLAIMRNLVPQAAEHLAPGGWLLVESGEYNAEETQRIFLMNGFRDTEIIKDLSGQLRVIKGRI